MTSILWRRSTSVLVLLIASLLPACTNGHEQYDGASRYPSPASGLSSPPADRVVSVCDNLTGYPALQIPKIEKLKSSGDDHIHDCSLASKVESPLKGYFHFKLSIESIWAEDGNSKAAISEARDRLVPNPKTPRLDPCVYGAECWLSEPDCSNTNPDSPDGPPGMRGYAAKALAYPYKIEIVVGLWPDDTEDLCEADTWSEKQAVKLLRHTVNYLLAKPPK